MLVQPVPSQERQANGVKHKSSECDWLEIQVSTDVARHFGSGDEPRRFAIRFAFKEFNRGSRQEHVPPPHDDHRRRDGSVDVCSNDASLNAHLFHHARDFLLGLQEFLFSRRLVFPTRRLQIRASQFFDALLVHSLAQVFVLSNAVEMLFQSVVIITFTAQIWTVKRQTVASDGDFGPLVRIHIKLCELSATLNETALLDVQHGVVDDFLPASKENRNGDDE